MFAGSLEAFVRHETTPIFSIRCWNQHGASQDCWSNDWQVPHLEALAGPWADAIKFRATATSEVRPYEGDVNSCRVGLCTLKEIIDGPWNKNVRLIQGCCELATRMCDSTWKAAVSWVEPW